VPLHVGAMVAGCLTTSNWNASVDNVLEFIFSSLSLVDQQWTANTCIVRKKPELHQVLWRPYWCMRLTAAFM